MFYFLLVEQETIRICQRILPYLAYGVMTQKKKALREKRTTINLRCQSTSRPITKDCQKKKKEKMKIVSPYSLR